MIWEAGGGYRPLLYPGIPSQNIGQVAFSQIGRYRSNALGAPDRSISPRG